MIAINDLGPRIARHENALRAAIDRVLASAWCVLGPEVAAFEAAFAAYLGVAHCVGVGNGTDALEIALRALDVGMGDSVATVPNAGMYTTTAVHQVGAQAYFMDVDPISRCVPLAEVEKALDAGVCAVVLTHLYGLLAPEVTAIAAACAARGIPLIEDCAQAHGALRDGKRAGSFGGLATFSFYPTKNMGALGDGGAVVTSDNALAERVRLLRQYGWTSKYHVGLAGARNSRLDALQAAMLHVFLPTLDADNARRRAIATAYRAGIASPHLYVPQHDGTDYVAHLFVVCCTDAPTRSALRAHLTAQGVGNDVHYPVPDHKQDILRKTCAHISLPQAEFLADRVLTLPCFPEMTQAQVGTVIAAVNSFTMP